MRRLYDMGLGRAELECIRSGRWSVVGSHWSLRDRVSSPDP
jgi:hypothetical protein